MHRPPTMQPCPRSHRTYLEGKQYYSSFNWSTVYIKCRISVCDMVYNGSKRFCHWSTCSWPRRLLSTSLHTFAVHKHLFADNDRIITESKSILIFSHLVNAYRSSRPTWPGPSHPNSSSLHTIDILNTETLGCAQPDVGMQMLARQQPQCLRLNVSWYFYLLWGRLHKFYSYFVRIAVVILYQGTLYAA